MSYDLRLIQYVSYTGVYGVSFWILLINILVLILLAKILLKEWTVSSKQSLSIVALLLAIYLLPKLYGTIALNEKSNRENKKIKIALKARRFGAVYRECAAGGRVPSEEYAARGFRSFGH